MMQILKDRWSLLLVIITFIIVKIPALHYPFFWDESWSYAPGVKLMYLHGPSLMPNAIDLFYSRGHPLLFYAAAATWMRIFGDSHISQHSFALFISVLLLITVYETTLRLFNKRVATLSLLLLATQVIFFVQSTLLLPEVMITWLALLTLYFYASGKYLHTLIACTALLLTKESGLVLGLILGVHAVCRLFSTSIPLRHSLKNLLSVAIPGLIIVIFFLAQKKLNGWYLFPEHTALINWSWIMFKGKVRFGFEIIFYHQFRYLLFLLLLLASVAAAIYYRNIRYAIPVLLGILLYIYIGEHWGYLSRRVFVPLVFAAFVYTIYSLNKLNKEASAKTLTFISLALCFVLTYHVFTCLNFFSDRYLLCSIVLFLILTAYCFDIFLRPFGKGIFYGAVTCMLAISAFAFAFPANTGDTDLHIYAEMKMQQDVVNYLEKNNMYHKHIATHSYLQNVHLTRPYSGFLRSDRVFTNVSYEIQPNTDLIIIDNIEPDSTAWKIPGDAFIPLYNTAEGQFHAEILIRK